MTNEVRDVIGYEGLYTVDALGNVARVKDNKLLKPHIHRCGYMCVVLRKDGMQKQKRIHRLVAEAFIPNPYNKPQVNHIDGNKKNNCVDNLEWCTNQENIAHSLKFGLRPQQRVMVVETGEVYENAKVCANAIGGNYGNVYHCIKGERKTHKGYHFKGV